jgi:serine/threonine protein kinase
METEFSHTVAVNVDPAASPTPVLPTTRAPIAPGGIVAGYSLQERLGVGGYGEVWRAIGPGGLPKAVKLLFGRSDGPQAETEMRSLQKIKDVRHPFILSVERIEVDDDRLVIVTELAEGSLEDRFFKVQEAKKRGIPREELLGYLRDAAEALDFMRESHGLQHLDVKPANLLLQGGRVKVADFGLVKELQQCSASLVSGFTPLYAAPEVFEGRPSSSSDQYSLAIVYQFLQCGTAPFSGRNPVQLMAQHISGKPDLSPLSPSDRAAVGRALSKTPTARFPSCRAFVEALEERRRSAWQPLPESPARAAVTPEPGTRTPRGVEPGSIVGCPQSLETSVFPPHDLAAGPSAHAPTLFVGIGGLAGRVLRHLKARLAGHFGAPEFSSVFPMLYLDSDPAAIESACTGTAGQALSPDDTLEIGLRDALAYRAQSPRLLEWLSRRWLYNISRSQRVEGMRPLGRLAFVDHGAAIRERLASVLRSATNEETVRRGAAAKRLRLDASSPEVFVVASICGGTGSGAVLDIGYLVRSVFEALGVQKPVLTGILLHATGRREDVAEVQRANAVACLRELAYLCQSHQGYPGDKAIGLPPSPEPPFDHTRLVHLGEDCPDGDLEAAASRVAEYLYRATATPARAFLERQRLDIARSEGSHETRSSLGTFGVGMLGDATAGRSTADPDALCRAVVARWLSRQTGPSEPPSGAEQSRKATAELFERLELTPEQLAAKAMEVVGGRSRKDAEESFLAQLRQILTDRASGDPLAARLRHSVAEHFESPLQSDPASDHPAAMLLRYRADLAAAGQTAANELRRQILAVADSSERRLAAASALTADMTARLADLATRVLDLVRDVDRDCETISFEADVDNRAAGCAECGEGLAGRYVRYAMVYFCKRLLQAISEYVAELRQRTKEVGGSLLGLRVKLEEVAACFQRQEVEPEADEDGSVRGLLERELAARANEPGEDIVNAFDAMLRRQGNVRLRSLVEEELPLDGFARRLREAAIEFALTSRPTTEDVRPTAAQDAAQAQDCENAAAPVLGQVGGGRRVLVTVPQGLSQESWRQRLVRKFGECVSVQGDSEDRVFVLCEVQGISLDAAASKLAKEDRRILEMASRLHTRTDVPW